MRSWARLFVAQRGSCVVQLTARGLPGHSAAQLPPSERAGVALARAMAALADADLLAAAAHPIDGTRPTVNIGTMVSGGITPFMQPESMTAIVEVRVIEGMTMPACTPNCAPRCAGPGWTSPPRIRRTTGYRQVRRRAPTG